MKSLRRKSCFTFIEMLGVVIIAGILVGVLIPAVNRVRARSGFVRWIAFNFKINRDPAVVVNYNFETSDYMTKIKGTYVPALYNGAVGSTAAGYDPANYNGLLRNNPEWILGGGRWPFKKALQFDGSSSYVQIIGQRDLDFDPRNDDFTIVLWVKFNNLKLQTLVSKGSSLSKSQYNLFARAASVDATVGNSSTRWKQPDLNKDTWLHLVLVNNAGKYYRVYLNSVLMWDTEPDKIVLPQKVKYRSGVIIGGCGCGGEGGGAGALEPCRKGCLGNFFYGRMDEFIIYNRALSEKEISAHYQIGRPY